MSYVSRIESGRLNRVSKPKHKINDSSSNFSYEFDSGERGKFFFNSVDDNIDFCCQTPYGSIHIWDDRERKYINFKKSHNKIYIDKDNYREICDDGMTTRDIRFLNPQKDNNTISRRIRLSLNLRYQMYINGDISICRRHGFGTIATLLKPRVYNSKGEEGIVKQVIREGDNRKELYHDIIIDPSWYYSQDNVILDPDFTLSSTVDFDAGTKSDPSDGNYGVETSTDNPSITAGQLELANRLGDNMVYTDADGDNWKGTSQYDAMTSDMAGASGASASIASNLLSSAIAGVSANTNYGVVLDTTIDNTGDWSIEVAFDNLVLPATANGFLDFTVGDAGGDPPAIDANNYALMRRNRNASLNRRIGIIYNNGNLEANVLEAETATSGKHRLRKVGTTVYCEYDYNGGYTTIASGTCANWASTLRVSIALASTGSFPDVSVDITYYHLTTGVLTTGYRTSGNWISTTQTMPSGEHLDEFTITYSGVSATETITPRILRASDDAVLWTGSAITSGTTKTYTTSDFGVIDVNFKWKMELAGDGSNTPVIESISGEAEAEPPISSNVGDEKLPIILL